MRAVFSHGASCAYGISPASQSFTAAGGASVINVTAGADCGWSAAVNNGATWVTVGAGGLGTGNGAINYTVAPNHTNAARAAALTVAGQTFSVTQGALQLTSFTLSPTAVVGGQASTGTLTLSGPAPSGGAIVSLTSSNPAVATVPASVTVPAGASSQTFSVAVQAVASSSTVNVSAAYAGQTLTVALTLTPAATAPTNPTASTNSVGRIELKWTDNSNNESGFRIERCQGQTCTNFAQLTVVGPNTTTYRNPNLPAGTYYRYRVRAFTNVGFSLYSNGVNLVGARGGRKYLSRSTAACDPRQLGLKLNFYLDLTQ